VAAALNDKSLLLGLHSMMTVFDQMHGEVAGQPLGQIISPNSRAVVLPMIAVGLMPRIA
jgi:hypothetical protein